MSSRLEKPRVLTPTPPTAMNRPIPIAPTPGVTFSTTSFTNKEWIVPPRPRPGRKPAGDAPPTKRKAQNREAQRAFRERRAAKVGELEDQLKILEEDHRIEIQQLGDRIEQLQLDLQRCTDQLASRNKKYDELEDAYRKERQSKSEVEAEVEALRKGFTLGTEAVALPLRKDRNSHHREAQGDPVPKQDAMVDDLTCGRCNNSSRCQCIEEAFDIAHGATGAENCSPSKRSHSPYGAMEQKRVRQDQDEENEIDFTSQFMTREPTSGAMNSSSASNGAPVPIEPCGFCNDGSTCICAELDTQTMQGPSMNQAASPVSQNNVAAANSNAPPAGCTNNPGNCAQCRSDPTSTLFCKTLAASRSVQKPQTMSQGSSNALQFQNYPQSVVAGPTLTCADAYSTLSRHHAFPQATNELGSWVSQLTAVPGTARVEGKTAFEIEVASVMSVLKFFDNRFGPKAEEMPEYSIRKLQIEKEMFDEVQQDGGCTRRQRN